jgi:hypothetical protein
MKYIKACNRYIESIKKTGAIYHLGDYLSSIKNFCYTDDKKLNKARRLAMKEGMKMVRPVSQHPPYLTEVLVRDDTINQFVTEQVPFSALVAPIDYNLYQSTGITDATEFNRKYGVTDVVDSPVIQMPESFKQGILTQSLMDIATSPKSMREQSFLLLE